MIAACPVLSLAGNVSVANSLASIDCQVEQAVEIGYDRLFGASGAFAEVLTVCLTIYIAMLAYGFLTGRTRLTVAMMSPRLTTLVLVLTFVTFWPAYHTIFYSLFMDGPDKVATALLAQHGSATMTFAGHLDQLFQAFTEIGENLQTAAQDATTTAASASRTATSATSVASSAGSAVSFASVPSALFWLAGIVFMLSTLGLLILTRLVLYLLLVLGPIFILLGLFDQTRGLFNGWVRSVFSFAIAPMLTVLGGNAALAMFTPLIGYIKNLEDTVGDVDLQPILVLFMGSLIYAAFLLVLMKVAGTLVHDWQAALRDHPISIQLPGTMTAVSPPAMQGQAGAVMRRSMAGDISVATSVSASGSSTSPAERQITIAAQPQAGGASLSRVRGLGQRFRSTPRGNESNRRHT